MRTPALGARTGDVQWTRYDAMHDSTTETDSTVADDAQEHRHTNTDHRLTVDTVDVDGQPYDVERCGRCGAYEPVLDGRCPGRNHRLDAFAGTVGARTDSMAGVPSVSAAGADD